MKKVLVTGGCGFLGSNIAAESLKRGDRVIVLDSLARKGSETNLEWLKTLGTFEFMRDDVANTEKVDEAVAKLKPDVIFHLAGQVAMTTSLENPRRDFETNVLGTINVLESARRHAPQALITYSSTNKVYGDLEDFRYEEAPTRWKAVDRPEGFDEQTRLDFRSPYGCSKGAADQYMLDYARCYGLNTVVLRHSSIFGSRQFSTYDQGWIGWFVRKALECKAGTLKEPFTISGDGKQVRDVLFASDLVSLYFAVVANADKARGQAFNIGGGMANSLSLLELFSFLEKEVCTKLRYERLPWRASDQKVFVADIAKAKRLVGWAPKVDRETGLRQMIEWVARHD